MQHSPRFLNIVNDAKSRVKQTSIHDVKTNLDRGERFMLIDVREESEFSKDHLPGAVHMGKGVIERDIELRVPDLNTPMVLYCGGGFRSALAADNLQRMGYTNVISMDGRSVDEKPRRAGVVSSRHDSPRASPAVPIPFHLRRSQN